MPQKRVIVPKPSSPPKFISSKNIYMIQDEFSEISLNNFEKNGVISSKFTQKMAKKDKMTNLYDVIITS